MSKETLADLNVNTLIGATDQRGTAWHRRDDLQGAEDNHYPGFIPKEDVLRRLFGWEPATVGVAYLVPIDPDTEEGNFLGQDGQWYRVVASQQGRIGVLRGDNDYDLGVFQEGSVHPSYADSLIRDAEILVGDELGITSAGLLAKGARAWVEMSIPETLHDAKSGFSYRPNLVSAASMDGSLALTRARTITATVCDNTLTWNLLEAKSAGVLVRRKHTSAANLSDIEDQRAALAIVNETAAEFERELHQLIETTVVETQFIEVLDIMRPLPADEGRARTMATNDRDRLMHLWNNDPMVSPWKGTALGVVQAFNTDQHHYANVRGTGRSERNSWRAISGKTAQADRAVVKALEQVLS